MSVDEEYDAVVVGARIAGSTVAALLGDAGHRVLLVDRVTFPSPTVSTHFFRGEFMVSVLEQLDVLGEVLELEPPRLNCQYLYTDGSGVPNVEPPQQPGDIGYCLSVRRDQLDHILVRRAQRSGNVTLAEGTQATGLIWDNDRVVGVRLKTSVGERSPAAKIVIGADGCNSFVARAVDADLEDSTPGFRALYYRYVRDFESPTSGPPDGPEFSFLGDQVAYVFPSDDGVTCLAISFNQEDFEEVRSDLETGFEAHIARHRGLADRYASATKVSEMRGYGPRPNYIHVPTGPGWALIGDAGLHQDPWTGYGIDMASTCGVFLAEVIHDWFDGTASETAAMERYHRRRNELAVPIYRETLAVGRDLRQMNES